MSEPGRKGLISTWEELAGVLDQLPAEQRLRLLAGFNLFAHDLRSALGIIYASQGLLAGCDHLADEDRELLEIILKADRRALLIIQELMQTLDHESEA